VGPEGIALGFNVLWMQYGGRRFTPWAESEGKKDRCFCLGTECATGAFANGLEYSLSHPRLLGSPTTAVIPAHGARRFEYCTALVPLETEGSRDGPLSADLGDDGCLVLKGKSSVQATKIDASFGTLRRFIALDD
jgi:hypothetical protein